MKKKIVIVGGGFTGLAAAYYLQKHFSKAEITILEGQDKVGGLAGGFKKPNWQWSVDYYYHHTFTSDKDLLQFLKELNLAQKLHFYSPLTSVWSHHQLIPFDSPLHLLTYPYLNLYQRLRLGFGLFFLKTLPNGLWLEKYSLAQKLPQIIGQKAYQEIFQPLVQSKFGDYSSQVNLAWFWARIKARSKRLAYYEGGLQQLAQELQKILIKKGVTFVFNQKIEKISQQNNHYLLFSQNEKIQAEIIILTTPPQRWWQQSLLKTTYQKYWKNKKYLGTQTLLLRLKNPFLKKTYWLNINHLDYPFLVLCEHTNMVPSSFYNSEHLLYIGNYLPQLHPYWSKKKEELFKLFWPYLKEINPSFNPKDILEIYKFQAKIAQPVVTPYYSHQLPPFQTLVPNIYTANIFQIYPFDRGINHSIRLGRELADEISKTNL